MKIASNSIPLITPPNIPHYNDQRFPLAPIPMLNPLIAFFYPSIILNYHTKTQGLIFANKIWLFSSATIYLYRILYPHQRLHFLFDINELQFHSSLQFTIYVCIIHFLSIYNSSTQATFLPNDSLIISLAFTVPNCSIIKASSLSRITHSTTSNLGCHISSPGSQHGAARQHTRRRLLYTFFCIPHNLKLSPLLPR